MTPEKISIFINSKINNLYSWTNVLYPGSVSWSYTDNEPDTKYDHAWSIAHFSRKVDLQIS